MMKKIIFIVLAILVLVLPSFAQYKMKPPFGDVINLRRAVVFFDDFVGGTNASGDVGENGWSFSASGGSMFAGADLGRPGSRTLRTNTTAGNRIGLSTLAVTILINGGEILEIGAKLSAAATSIVRLGFGDTYNSANFPTDGIWFEFNTDSSATNWHIGASAGGTKTFTQTSKTADTNWHRYKIKVSDDASSASFYIDDVLIGSVSSNIPGSAQYTGIMMYIETTDVNSNDLVIDYVYYKAPVSR